MSAAKREAQAAFASVRSTHLGGRVRQAPSQVVRGGEVGSVKHPARSMRRKADAAAEAVAARGVQPPGMSRLRHSIPCWVASTAK